LPDGAGIPARQGGRRACALTGDPQGYRPLADVLRDNLGRKYTKTLAATRPDRNDQDNLVCTTFVTLVLTNSSGRHIMQMRHVMPGHFLTSPDFDVQPLEWQRC